MSVVETDIVDAMGVEVSSGKLVLSVSDHLGWDEEAKHVALLEAKLNTYLRFIESGEVLESFPDAAGRSVVIDVVSRVEPSGAGVSFLLSAGRTMKEAGLELRYRVYRDLLSEK